MQSKLKARLARLGQIRDIVPARSGSPAELVLRPASGLQDVRTIDATRALVGCGLSMLKAKRAIEAMTERGEIALNAPAVAEFGKLAKQLEKAGVRVAKHATGPVDVRKLRERLNLTQEQFALRYNLSIDSVQHWELGDRTPDRAANNFLRVIAANPDLAARAQEDALV